MAVFTYNSQRGLSALSVNSQWHKLDLGCFHGDKVCTFIFVQIFNINLILKIFHNAFFIYLINFHPLKCLIKMETHFNQMKYAFVCLVKKKKGPKI